MGFLDALFGRTKPIQAKREAMFGILKAQALMVKDYKLQPAGSAGLVLRPVASTFFDSLDQQARDLLQTSARETGTTVEVKDDTFGYRWVVLRDPDFEDLVATIHLVTDLVVEKGFGDRLLAAVFRFRLENKDVYWVYNFKRGTFYPFMPNPGKQTRDNQEELRLASAMEKGKDMKIEGQVEQWYALWDLPV